MTREEYINWCFEQFEQSNIVFKNTTEVFDSNNNFVGNKHYYSSDESSNLVLYDNIETFRQSSYNWCIIRLNEQQIDALVDDFDDGSTREEKLYNKIMISNIKTITDGGINTYAFIDWYVCPDGEIIVKESL
jgi:hypothetical protein